ncbi:MAG: V-type ATP synthase subunit E [Nanobdellota archaeon]
MITIEGVDKLKEKIISNADNEVEKILSEAKQKAESIAAENKKKADSFLESEKERIKSEARLYEEREVASAEMESRKNYMEEREKIISDVIEKALSGINKTKAYKDFIKKAIEENGKGMEVYCNRKDMDLVKKYTSKVKEGDMRAGLILKGKETRINLSVSDLLDEKKKQIRQSIVKALGA